MKKFGLIGRVLGHSFSPIIHSMLADYEYKLYEVEPYKLDDFLHETDCDGFNVTMPYKIDVMRSCEELSDRAKLIGCVNTMTRTPDGSWRGDNTDWDGFLALLGDDAKTMVGRPAIILGSGGGAHTVRSVFSSCGIPHTVISRKGYDNYDNLEKHADAEIIVNSTPLGMYPKNGKAAIDLRKFPKCRLVIDLVYNPSRTALLLQADELGIPARGGLLMLAGQGVRAAEIFSGNSLPADSLEKVYDHLVRTTQNVVIIGMPGSGKTTTAMALGRLTGRKAYDIDTFIVERAGMSIPEIFATGGETEFRRLETEVLADLSKLSGVIIATGGGVVTQPRNLPLIRQNSICVYLTRDKDLPTDGRPLSQRDGVEKLRKQRLPLYRAWGQMTATGPSAEAVAQIIKDELKI